MSKEPNRALYLAVVCLFLLVLACLVPPSAPQVSPAKTQTGEQKTVLAQSLFLAKQDFAPVESPDLLIVQGTGLRAAPAPATLSPKVLGSLLGSEASSELRKDVFEYTVESGDTLYTIADEFDVSLETILWANDLTKGSLIKVGQKLVILPVSGIVHHVNKGDTVSALAQTYKVKADEIISFNGLLEEGDIFVGDILIVPGGVMPAATAKYVSQTVPLASSYFICPIAPPCRITQGLHWYNAVDFSHGQCGEPIYAAAGGIVLRVNLTNSLSRWAFEGAGNHITILHPNGVVTFYGHISQALISPGEQVSQGQIIATIGGEPGTAGAGRSTGCHVHFALHGARNPFAK